MAVDPEGPPDVAALRRTLASDTSAVFLLAAPDSVASGCGIAARSQVAGAVFAVVRQRPDRHRSGVGNTLCHALVEHARTTWLHLAANLLPTTLGVEVSRKLLLEGGSLASAWSDQRLVWLLAHSAAMLMLGVVAYQFAIRRALREGRLGPR